MPRATASATYGFVRFVGGGLAPFAAGLTAAAEQAVREVPGLPDEAVIAEDALEHDRRAAHPSR